MLSCLIVHEKVCCLGNVVYHMSITMLKVMDGMDTSISAKLGTFSLLFVLMHASSNLVTITACLCLVIKPLN